MTHTWKPRGLWLQLDGVRDALVRTKPFPDGYMWQFRKVVSYARTIEEAKDYVEAGAEYYAQFRRNPYAT